MNKSNVLNTEVQTMTSKEICELTRRQHDNTLTSIRLLIDAELIKEYQYEKTSYVNLKNQERKMIKLDKISSIIVVARQAPEFTAELMQRWDGLENIIISKSNVLNRGVKTMTSKEICKLTGRRHARTMTLIRSLIDAELIKEYQYEITSYVDLQNQERVMIKLDRHSAITVIARQSPEVIAKLVARWDELT